jgi:hypothetical protein
MKKVLLTIVWLLSLTVAMNAAPQNDPVVTDSSAVDEVEVFSDTTGVDSTAMGMPGDPWADWDDPFDDDWDDEWDSDNGFHIGSFGLDGNDIMGMFFGVCILFLLFVLSPVAVIGLILYFVYKNRKERMRMIEMALKNGKKIPLDVLGNPVMQNDALLRKGIKQVFLGAGLGILLWIVIGKLGLGIGALILLIGCGNLVIAYQAKSKLREKEMRDIFNKHKDEEIG